MVFADVVVVWSTPYLLDHAKQSVRFFRCEAVSRGMGYGCGFLRYRVHPFRYRVVLGYGYGYGVSDKMLRVCTRMYCIDMSKMQQTRV